MSTGEGVTSPVPGIVCLSTNGKQHVPPLCNQDVTAVADNLTHKLSILLGMTSLAMLPVTISKIKSLSENKERKQVEPVAQLHSTSPADWPTSCACLLASAQAHFLAKQFFLLYAMLTLNSIHRAYA